MGGQTPDLVIIDEFSDWQSKVEGRWDDQTQGWIIQETDEWIVSVTPMIFNDRVVLTHRSEYPYAYVAGWCYDKGGAAHLGAAAWDLTTQSEPVGYKKMACDARPDPRPPMEVLGEHRDSA